MRPRGDTGLLRVALESGALTHADGGARIEARDVALHAVDYVPVTVPSYFENPSGDYPDPLRPVTPRNVEPGESATFWITVNARRSLPPGRYTGTLTLTTSDYAAVPLTLEVEVWPFALPRTPTLQTDFGWSLETATRAAFEAGGSGRGLEAAWLAHALDHRITLREAAALPGPGADFGGSLARFDARVDELRDGGATTFYVPPGLLDMPEQLARANEFVVRKGLRGRAFTQLADEPTPPVWPNVLERVERWNALAPDIRPMVTTAGLSPFLPPALGQWAVHAQVLDTTNAQQILERVTSGENVWWYVNHAPPRPYPNFFIDFAAIEHRVFFWHTWGIGMRGVHYWRVDYLAPAMDPQWGLQDITPANGDGLLLYPGPDGPVNTIRFEVLRDGIEDYDLLTLFRQRVNALAERGGSEALIEEARAELDLDAIIPNLVGFTREPEALLAKREALASLLVRIEEALQR